MPYLVTPCLVEAVQPCIEWNPIKKNKHGNNIHEHRKQYNKWSTQICSNLSQRLDLKSSNKDAALQNLLIYYNWKNIRQQYKKLIALDLMKLS